MYSLYIFWFVVCLLHWYISSLRARGNLFVLLTDIPQYQHIWSVNAYWGSEGTSPCLLCTGSWNIFPYIIPTQHTCATNLPYLSPSPHSDLSQSSGCYHFSPSLQSTATPGPFNLSPIPAETIWMVFPLIVQCSSPSMSRKSKPTSNYPDKKRNGEVILLQPPGCHNQHCPPIKWVDKSEHIMSGDIKFKSLSWAREHHLLFVLIRSYSILNVRRVFS